MNILTISYAALKLVVAGGAFTVYYGVVGGGYAAVIVSAGAQPSLQCNITDPSDIADFDATIKPTATEVNEVGDAFALVPLGITPPAP